MINFEIKTKKNKKQNKHFLRNSIKIHKKKS